MTLKEKYTVKNGRGIGRLISFCSFLALYFVLYTSLARYETLSEGYAKIEIADWKIALNGKTLKSGENILRDTIELKQTSDGGYFDIIINPEGTEVSFEYQITLEPEKCRLPEGLTFSSYSVDNGDSRPLQDGRTAKGAVYLADGSDVLRKDAARTVTYYCKWADGYSKNSIEDYTIDISAEVRLAQAIKPAEGETSARFCSIASMTGGSKLEKIVGKVELYEPGWIWGYNGTSGIFEAPQIPADFVHIHYRVQNKVDEEINQNAAEYYLKIVAEDGSDNIPIEYNVHEYDKKDSIYPFVRGIGYGPFSLGSISESTQYYSIRANWTSTRPEHLKGVQKLKVQMVRKRENASLKVMSEAPLYMQYTGGAATNSVMLYNGAEAPGEGEVPDETEASGEGETPGETEPSDEAEASDEGEPSDEAEAPDEGEPSDETEASDEGEPSDETEASDEGEPSDETEASDEGEPSDEAEAPGETEPSDEAEAPGETEPSDEAGLSDEIGSPIEAKGDLHED